MHDSPHRHALLVLSLVTLCWSGCGRSPAESTPADPDRAVAALQTALDGWKANQTVAEVRSATGVIAQDADWETACQLLDYKISGPAKEKGSFLRCPVELVVIDATGREVSKTVHYLVGTGTHVTVRREIFAR